MPHSSAPPPPPPAPRDPAGEALHRLVMAHPAEVVAGMALRDLTTLRIGGPAAAVCRVRTPDDARRFLEFAAGHDLPTIALGGGSNVLAADGGFRGCILRLDATEFTIRGDTVTAGAGLPFDTLVARALAAGLTGLEFASGIPGTVGGAVVGNAGCFGHEIGEFLVEATVLDADGRLATVGPERFAFGYRRSALQGDGAIVLAARLRLGRGDPAVAGRERLDRLAERRRKHPTVEPSAGSWFRNLPPATPGGRRRAAGELLDAVGAKAMHEGDAAVFPGHANIIINRGTATAAQVRTLVARMREAVRDRFGVTLAEEVRTLGRDGFVAPALADPDAGPSGSPAPCG
ncbi:MAG: UDP-N-acetylmuramate dehydrogenase [Candidatus Krumholzibacteriia bacterium]